MWHAIHQNATSYDRANAEDGDIILTPEQPSDVIYRSDYYFGLLGIS